MMKLLTLLSLLLALSGAFAGDSKPDKQAAELLFKRGINALQEDQSTDVVFRFYQAALAKNPQHLEANWQVVNRKLWPIERAAPQYRAERLLAVQPEIERVKALAIEQGKPAFAHYVQAFYLRAYTNFDRALAELDQALSLSNDNPRYRYYKADFTFEQGELTGNEALKQASVKQIEQALEAAKQRPYPIFVDYISHYNLAISFTDLDPPNYPKAIEHYQQSLQLAPPGSGAEWRALVNVSSLYRYTRQCDQAKQTAEQANTISDNKTTRKMLDLADICRDLTKISRN